MTKVHTREFTIGKKSCNDKKSKNGVHFALKSLI